MMVLKSMVPCGTTILCEIIALGSKWNSFLFSTNLYERREGDDSPFR